MAKTRIVVVGNGMVGHRFIEELMEQPEREQFEVMVFGEENRIAYDRVHLSAYFSHHTADELSLSTTDYYQKHGIELHLNEKVISLNPQERLLLTNKGRELTYDKLVLATGAYPWVPPIEGANRKNCFTYRTIDDLDAIESVAKKSTVGVVVGGGLLGLEAAGALKALGLETHVVEFAPVLMAEQLDEAGGLMLQRKIEAMGVQVHTRKNTKEIIDGDSRCHKMCFADGSELEADLILFSTGIRPQDELARKAELPVGARGGIEINDQARSANEHIYAIGECASWNGMFYGLVAPGYKMAQVAAATLCGGRAEFSGADLSAKLKLLGVDVGGIGDAHGRTPGAISCHYANEAEGIYKRLVISADGKKLLGAVLVGDTSDYGDLLQFKLNEIELPENPEGLILPSSCGEKPALGVDALPESAVICSCFDVSKGDIAQAVSDGCTSVAELKATTKAGTGCGGCIPSLTQVLNVELSKQGIEVNDHLCEHFEFSRQELFHLVRVEGIKSFDELLAKHGKGYGCEVCKPTVGSILSSCWGDYLLDQDLVALQDTNDNFLGNMQKDGTYSVIPRMPGGEVTPQGLMAIAKVAEEFNLYTKMTGAQRLGMFGAQKDDLPAIWQQLIDAGFETGQAYAKALRMAKACVGSTWCRFGVQDSLGLGVEIENRYKGIRMPHKLKVGVSGCTRECSEAQGKDIGVIATDKGWNLYVCGNGGMTPRHADLLASDLSKEQLFQYIDRFLMFYIRTADKLQRTARWMESLEGGLEYLQQVIIEDTLELAETLEADMTRIRSRYHCEWRETLNNPESQKRFAHFINSERRDPLVQMVNVREQHRPARLAERIDTIELV